MALHTLTSTVLTLAISITTLCQHPARSKELGVGTTQDNLFDCARTHEAYHQHLPCLPEPVNAICRLGICLGVPVMVVEEDSACSGQVEAQAARTS